MHIFFSIFLLVIQFMLSYSSQAQIFGVVDKIPSDEIVAQVDLYPDEEELVYNGVVYFDDDTNMGNTDEGLNEDKIIGQVDNVSQNEKIENGKNLQKEKITNNDTQVVYQEDDTDEEEEIIFHDDFDTGYREDLEEIWSE